MRKPRLALLSLLIVALTAPAACRRPSEATPSPPPEMTPDQSEPTAPPKQGSQPRDSGLPAPELVILISLDTLRADRLGCYGYERDTSPNLDALAAEGTRFATVASQAAQTLISHKSLFAAKYPLHIIHETTNADLNRLANLENPAQFTTSSLRQSKSQSLVAVLRDGGYQTAGLVDGGWMRKKMGFDQGFDLYNDRGKRLPKILPRALKWLKKNPGGRRFLFLHAYDIHCPYWTRPKFNNRWCTDHTQHVELRGKCPKSSFIHMDLMETDLRAISDHYDSGIASADAFLGRFFRILRERDIYSDTLIIITSDHGESLGENGRLGHGGLYIEELMIPLIVKPPSSWGWQPQVVAEPVELVDVMPTILAACGVAPPSDIDGRSLLPLMQNSGSGRKALIAQITYREWPDLVTRPAKRAVWEPGHWLMIHDVAVDQPEVYDLTIDARGLSAAASPEAGVVTVLLDTLGQHDPGEAIGEFADPGETEIDDELREELESLGYIED